MAAQHKLFRTLSLCVILATLFVFLPTLRHGFVDYDDTLYVTANPTVQAGLSAENVTWAFKTFDAANWHPLTWLSHMLDCELYGLDPSGHHLTSLLIHAANAWLLLFLLFSFTGRIWESAFAAALFALHPLRVESVAWVAERKDVLGVFFWLATTLLYGRWALRPSPGRYAAALTAFGLGLMSKPSLVTLPFALLLVDRWPLGRWKKGAWRALAIEKIPFFVFSALSCWATIAAQREVIELAEVVPLSLRLASVPISYMRYIGKFLVPADLTVFYADAGLKASWRLVAEAAAAGTVLAAATIAAARARRPYLLVGWLWFLGTLVPMIGLVKVGAHSIADRYTYIPQIGLAVIVVWRLGELAASRRAKTALAAAGCLALVALGVTTRAQLRHWKDTESLWRRSLAIYPNVARSHRNLGLELLRQGRLDEAEASYRRAIELSPRVADAHVKLGSIAARAKRYDEAVEHFRTALALDARQAAVQNNAGLALLLSGRPKEAVAHFRAALALAPDDRQARNGLGVALAQEGELEEAVSHLRRALAADPNDAEANRNLALLLKRRGRMREAEAHLRSAAPRR